MEQFGDGQVGDLVVDRAAEEDDPLAQEAGVDVEGALAARGLLDDDGDQRAHAGSLRPRVDTFAVRERASCASLLRVVERERG